MKRTWKCPGAPFSPRWPYTRALEALPGPYACAGADGAELGLALIGRSKSPAAPWHLAGLPRFRMDGALSADYRCYLAAQGSSVVRATSKLDAGLLAKQCLSEFAAFKQRAGTATFDVAPENI
ncbi:Imm57 family immunity protein [Streptomyces sp. NPDC056450]|uniref:Imm57 family immunity protein n=1 Tax=Bacillati TaxID=1783272 RepID=UPI0016514725|nr:hypothetical protein [Stenotrophomonas maltophilia]MBH1502390.1 hypothetical protein [Stenotrophomonas maltophilia]MBH1785462.1 hypothetical protein [Stenotrophomonas maltophilia]